jgi:hypothetical protein
MLPTNVDEVIIYLLFIIVFPDIVIIILVYAIVIIAIKIAI